MSQINVLAPFRAKSEHREELKERLTALAEAVHTEPGCLLYSLQQGTDEADVFATWRSGSRRRRSPNTARPPTCSRGVPGGAP